MTYKIIDTTTGTITNCSLLSMSRKLEPNTILAEYNAAGVLLTSYPISSVDIRRISVYFDPNAAYFSYAVELAVRAAYCAAANADTADLATHGAAYRAAHAAYDAADAADTAARVAAAAADPADPAVRDAAYAALADASATCDAADAAWRDARAARSAYTDRLISKSKSAEYKRQGQFILDYLRAGSI